MENLPSRNMNPPESNAPDCPQCGAQMETKRGIAGQFYTCENYLCELYTGDKDDRICELLSHIDALQGQYNEAQRRAVDAEAEVRRLQAIVQSPRTPVEIHREGNRVTLYACPFDHTHPMNEPGKCSECGGELLPEHYWREVFTREPQP